MSCVIVMGCYRSGTSAVAGILHHLGVRMGENFQEPNSANPKGYFEDPEFINMNLKLHEMNKLIKLNPHIEYAGIIDEFHQLCYERYSHFNLDPFWGFKDPKFCLTAKHVMHKIADPPMSKTAKIIWIHRNVDDTIHSLIKTLNLRGKDASVHKWRTFVNHYITETSAYMAGHEANNVLNINFEGLIDAPSNFINIIANFIGLPTTQGALDFLGQPEAPYHFDNIDNLFEF